MVRPLPKLATYIAATKAQFEPAGFFLLRTALYPTDFIGSSLTDVSVQHLFTNDLVAREALYLASPTLDQALDRALHSRLPLKQSEVVACARYLQRMAYRATPFGLFAGCAVGTIGQSTSIVLGSRRGYRRRARLGADYLETICQGILSTPGVLQRLSYVSNSSLALRNDEWRYVATVRAGGHTAHQLASLARDQYLDAAIATAATAGAPWEQIKKTLLSLVADDEDTDESDVENYLTELVDNSVLIPLLGPALTGDQGLGSFTSVTSRIDDLAEHSQALANLDEAIEQLNRAELGIPKSDYTTAQSHLEKVCSGAKGKMVFQVDLVSSPIACEIDRALAAEIQDAVSVLHLLTPPAGGGPLERFKTTFLERYERRQVPLADVLDEDSGIGFDVTSDNAPILHALPFGGAGGPVGQWTSRDSMLLGLLERSMAGRQQSVSIEEADVKSLLGGHRTTLPDSFSAIVALLKPNPAIPDAPHIVLRSASGPSGANLMARFCHSVPELTDWVKAVTRRESDLAAPAVLVEVVHQPEGRVGNILSRPVLRDIELSYLGMSGAPVENQVRVSDLLVSIEGDRVVLRSKSLGREVVPRLTTAHNYSRGHSLYRFLCSLQIQAGAPWVGWSWGSLEGAVAFLPRVMFRRTVLTRARWQLPVRVIGQLQAAHPAAARKLLRLWQEENGVPVHAAFADADNELPVCFDSDLSIDAFVHDARKRKQVVLKEMLPGPGESMVAGPEGSFGHEILLPFLRKTRPQHGNQPSPRPVIAKSNRRTFAPGSEWHFVKWYGGIADLETVLVEDIGPLIARLQESRLIVSWFFIRYADPHFHIRLRFRSFGAESHAVANELAILGAHLLDSGKLWRVQNDTYEREIERYGGPEGIELSERLFWKDSEVALRVLDHFRGAAGLEGRWRACLVTMDAILDAMEFDLSAKLEIVRAARNAAHGGTVPKELHLAMGTKFRTERRLLEEILGGQLKQGFFGPSHALAEDAIAELVICARDVGAAVRDLRLDTPGPNLIRSYLHMHANRILRSEPVKHEVVLYDFLARIYLSKLARRDTLSPEV